MRSHVSFQFVASTEALPTTRKSTMVGLFTCVRPQVSLFMFQPMEPAVAGITSERSVFVIYWEARLLFGHFFVKSSFCISRSTILDQENSQYTKNRLRKNKTTRRNAQRKGGTEFEYIASNTSFSIAYIPEAVFLEKNLGKTSSNGLFVKSSYAIFLSGI